MNRLFVLLALAATGTGCVVSDTCETRTVSVGWSSFMLDNGAVTTSCSTADLTSVDVWMDGNSFVGNFPCAAGGVNITGVLAGSHTYTVEGKSGSQIVLRDFARSGGDGCGTLLLDTQPAAGAFELAYSFTPVNECTPGASYIWFTLYDETTGTASVVYEDASWPCSSSIQLALPIGPWTLERTEEAFWNGSTYQATARNCSASAFDVGAGALSSVPSAMVDSSTFCP